MLWAAVAVSVVGCILCGATLWLLNSGSPASGNKLPPGMTLPQR